MIPNELEQLPAVRTNLAVRVALVADSSMIPRRHKAGEPSAYHLEPSVELDMYALEERLFPQGDYDIRDHRTSGNESKGQTHT